MVWLQPGPPESNDSRSLVPRLCCSILLTRQDLLQIDDEDSVVVGAVVSSKSTPGRSGATASPQQPVSSETIMTSKGPSSSARPPQQTDLFWTMRPYEVKCKMIGRLGNNMFQYSFCRLYAMAYNMSLSIANLNNNPAAQYFDRSFPAAVQIRNTQHHVAGVVLRGFFQSYSLYKYT